MIEQKRKTLSKKTRELVYKKYSGHCAYCGCELEYKDMQVDHIDSVFHANYYGRYSAEELNNYNPSCRQCNFYKGSYPIEEFRKNLETMLWHKLEKDFNYRLLKKYGQIEEHRNHIKFYFEKCERKSEVEE